MVEKDEVPPVYFAVGPKPQEVVCPYCKRHGMTVLHKVCCYTVGQYCSSCGEYLGKYRRPKM